MIPSKITRDPRKPERRLPGRYRVIGARTFREHVPGTEFVAFLDPAQEGRAVRRGDIRLLERLELSVADLPHVLPSAEPSKIPLERKARGAEPRRLTTLERR